MMIRSLIVFAALGWLALSPQGMAQDALVTLDDLRIEGTITGEDDRIVTIDTRFGEFEFEKINLKRIERLAPEPAKVERGFGGYGLPKAAVDRGVVGFGMAAGSRAGGGNPFGGPFGANGGDDDPFGSPTVQRTAAAAVQPEQEEPGEGLPFIPKFAETIEMPRVSPGYDAVVYGIGENAPVEIKAAPDADFAPAMASTDLRTGSEVRTNETQSSRIRLRDKEDEIRLPVKSHIAVAQLSADSEEVILELRAGSVWADVAPRSTPDAFQVRTPELTAGVRGTRFRVDRNAGASKVSVLEGSVRVTANRTGAFVTLEANEAAVVNLRGQILDIIAVPVDEQQIWDDWDQWAQDATYGSGSYAAAFGPVSGLTQNIAADNARWQTMMEEYQRNVAENRYMQKLDEYADAFLRFARDTGHIPTTEEGFSVLKFDTGYDGWQGPYVEGPIPPLDPWRQPLVYRKDESPTTGRVFGRVYSLWQDGRDQGGRNNSVDRLSLVLYYQLERFANDADVNPPVE